jgi:protease-4
VQVPGRKEVIGKTIKPETGMRPEGCQVPNANSIISLLVVTIVISYLGAGLSATYLRMNKQVGVVQLLGYIGSFSEITEQLRWAEDDPRFKGMVLYVNSGGGAAFACMEIRRYLENMTKPNVAVMDELAASGAYYISSAADEVIAHANTITGALSVISVWEDYSEFLENEGIRYWVWKTGQAKDLYAPWRSPTAEENETIQTELNRTYEVLIGDIAGSRPNLTIEDVRELANGSVYSGLQALELGLIDRIGDQSQAIRKVASRTGLGRYLVRDLSQSDGEVLTSLATSYFLSSVTVVIAAVLICLGVIKAALGKRGKNAGGVDGRWGV